MLPDAEVVFQIWETTTPWSSVQEYKNTFERDKTNIRTNTKLNR